MTPKNEVKILILTVLIRLELLGIGEWLFCRMVSDYNYANITNPVILDSFTRIKHVIYIILNYSISNIFMPIN